MIARNPFIVTYSVWKALFIRELFLRLFSKRMGTIWLLAEPVFSIVMLMAIFSIVQVSIIGGLETAVWLLVGMSGFFMFRRTGMVAMKAIHMNRPLFTYRQVKPVDTVLVRAAVEGLIMFLVVLILLAGGMMVGLDVIPGDPLLAFAQLGVLWMLGMGFALWTSVLSELVPEVSEVLNIIMLPAYFVSGVIFPIHFVPLPYLDWLLWNPLVHAIEGMRLGFEPNYRAVQGLDLWFPIEVALVMMFFGMLLHRRFAVRLLAS